MNGAELAAELRIRLTPIEHKLMVNLRPNRIITRRRVCSAMYRLGGADHETALNRLKTVIARIRPILRERGWEIESVPGCGIRLVPKAKAKTAAELQREAFMFKHRVKLTPEEIKLIVEMRGKLRSDMGEAVAFHLANRRAA